MSESKTTKRPFAVVLAVVLLAASGVAIYAYTRHTAPAGRAGSQPPPVPVTTARVARRTVPIRLSVIGTAEAYSTVTVRARVDGQVLTAEFQPGQAVHKGEILFHLDPRPFQAQLDVAQANLGRDRAQLDNARRTLTRYTASARNGFVTKQQLDDARASVATLEQTVRADQAAQELARLQLGYATIPSPIEGVTGSVLANPGNTVKANDTALVVINQVRPIYVSFAVPEVHLAAIRRRLNAGEVPVEVTVPGADSPALQGRLTFINNAVDSATGTIQLKAVFGNGDEGLTPGQFVNVALGLGAWKNALIVPSQAVQRGQQGSFVYVVGTDRTVQPRPVTAVSVPSGESVVTHGLALDDEVVVDGQLRLHPGSKVAPRPAGAS